MSINNDPVATMASTRRSKYAQENARGPEKLPMVASAQIELVLTHGRTHPRQYAKKDENPKRLRLY